MEEGKKVRWKEKREGGGEGDKERKTYKTMQLVKHLDVPHIPRHIRVYLPIIIAHPLCRLG